MADKQVNRGRSAGDWIYDSYTDGTCRKILNIQFPQQDITKGNQDVK